MIFYSLQTCNGNRGRLWSGSSPPHVNIHCHAHPVGLPSYKSKSKEVTSKKFTSNFILDRRR